MFNVVDMSTLDMIVGHPNGTKASVTQVGSLKLTDKIVIEDVLVVGIATGQGILGLYLPSPSLFLKLIFIPAPNPIGESLYIPILVPNGDLGSIRGFRDFRSL
nr:ribonuclease H-like domain-containing protein [Tanacetum cinerariifolium]